MDLVLPDEDHAARVDDVGAVLDEIAARSRDLIIDLELMVDVETGHIIPHITVDALHKKIVLRAVGIF